MACCGSLWEAFLGSHSWNSGEKALRLSHESYGTKKGTKKIWSTAINSMKLLLMQQHDIDYVKYLLQAALPDHLGSIFSLTPGYIHHGILLYGPLQA